MKGWVGVSVQTSKKTWTLSSPAVVIASVATTFEFLGYCVAASRAVPTPVIVWLQMGGDPKAAWDYYYDSIRKS